VNEPRPFAATAGRDFANDRPLAIDIPGWYYAQRERLAADADVLRQLIAAVDWPNDLVPSQWAQWYSLALGFRPDLIIELGRGMGNSTALFCQAAAALGNVEVVSLCHSIEWAARTAPRIANVVDPEWFEPLDARVTDIVTTDYAQMLSGRRRVLLLWDAHGFEIAEVVLGEILPRLLDREHLVVMHDILDNRYMPVGRSYNGQPIWKGSEWQQRTGCSGARVNIGWMHAIQDQIVAIADFSARNDVDLESADHEYTRFFGAHSDLAAEMRASIGDEFFSTTAQWAFFSLSGRVGPFYFPAVKGRRAFANRGAIVLDQGLRLPASVTTAAQPWAFASAWRWRPTVDPPEGADAWLRVRLRIAEASIGLGLLGQNGADFTVRRALSPARQPIDVLLPVADLSSPGQLVIHTWAAPVAAHVQVEEVSLVW
jgi:hypothetical protein